MSIWFKLTAVYVFERNVDRPTKSASTYWFGFQIFGVIS